MSADESVRRPGGAVIYRRLLRYVWPHWRYLAVAIFGMVVFAATPAALVGMWNTGFQANTALAAMGVEMLPGWRETILLLLGGGHDPGFETAMRSQPDDVARMLLQCTRNGERRVDVPTRAACHDKNRPPRHLRFLRPAAGLR